MFMLYYLTDDLNTYGTTCKTPLICSYSTPARAPDVVPSNSYVWILDYVLYG